MSRRSSWQRETLLRGALLAAALTLAIPAAAGASGESVPLNTFDLPAGASVTVTFEVTVDSPLGVCAAAVSNQGTLSGGNFTTLATDDRPAPRAGSRESCRDPSRLGFVFSSTTP
jgi:hypothetical protein